MDQVHALLAVQPGACSSDRAPGRPGRGNVRLSRDPWACQRSVVPSLVVHLNDHPDVHQELRFCNELAHLVYAGSDLLVMPRMFEPCGLTQLVALEYGTVPIVRACGGLHDTIADRDYSWHPPEQRNGYVFNHADHPALESAMARAIGLW